MFRKYFKKKSWLDSRQRRRRPQLYRPHYLKHKEQAKQVITERVVHFASTYNFSYGKIAIRNSRRSWGSCSNAGNLNFHYRLLFLPPEIRDYVIVHELCHLRVFNHSQAFWSEVEQIMPNFQQYRKILKQYEKQTAFRAMMLS